MFEDTIIREEVGVGVIIQNDSGKFTIATPYGLQLIDRYFDKIFCFYGAVGIVSDNGKYGVLNSNSELILDTEYDGFALTDNKFLILRKADLWTVIGTDTGSLHLKEVSKEEMFSYLHLSEDILEELSENWL